MINCSDNTYYIYYTDANGGAIAIPIAKSALDQTTLDIALVGKTRLEYGDIFNENMLHLMESFASPSSDRITPEQINTYLQLLANPVVGQFWYNSAHDSLNVCVQVDPDIVWKALPNKSSIAGNSGILFHGELIPLPIATNGYEFSQAECSWHVSPYYVNSNYRINGFDVSADNRLINCVFNTTAGDINGFVSYMILGVRGYAVPDKLDAPCPIPTITPTVSQSPTPTVTRSPTPTISGTPMVTPTLTRTPTMTRSPTPSVGASSTPTPTPTVSVSESLPAVTPTPTPTITVTATVTPTMTMTPTVTPTSGASPTPTVTPTMTVTPSASPDAGLMGLTFDTKNYGIMSATNMVYFIMTIENDGTWNISMPTAGANFDITGDYVPKNGSWQSGSPLAGIGDNFEVMADITPIYVNPTGGFVSDSFAWTPLTSDVALNITNAYAEVTLTIRSTITGQTTVASFTADMNYTG